MKSETSKMETILEKSDVMDASDFVDTSSSEDSTDAMNQIVHDQSLEMSFATLNNSSFMGEDAANCSILLDFCGTRLLQDEEGYEENSSPIEEPEPVAASSQSEPRGTSASLMNNMHIKHIIEKNKSIKRHMEALGIDFVSELNSVHVMYKSMLLDFHSKAAKEICVYKQELDTALVEKRRLHNKIQEMKGNIRVLCRVRPSTSPSDCAAECRKGGQLLTVNVPSKGIDRNGQQRAPEQKTFSFDCVLGPQSSQEDVYNEVRGMVDSAYDGYHCTVVAYGQTGAGKTFTMQGTDENPGISKNTLRDVFQMKLKKESSGMQSVSIFVSMIEVYNETFRDLLSDGPGAKIEVRESVQGVVSIHGARHVPVTCAEDVEAVARRGQRNRAVGSTKCNNQSSRSHMVLMIDLEVRERSVFENPEASTSDHRVVSTGRISLVDLAGSERISKSEASGAALTEAKHINKSLSALIDVISALSERERKSKLKQQQQKDGQSTSGAETKTRKSSQASNETTSDVFHHIPFRNSKLTHLLMGSLKPGSKLVFIAQIAPENEHVVETCNTLEFGTRAKGVELGKSKDAAAKQVCLENAERNIDQLTKEVDRLNKINSTLTQERSTLETTVETSKQLVADYEAKYNAALNEAKNALARAAHVEAQMSEMEKRVASLVSLNQSLSEKNSKLKDAETKLTQLLKNKEKEDARSAGVCVSTESQPSRRSTAPPPSIHQTSHSSPAAALPFPVKEEKSEKKRKSTVELEESSNTSFCNTTSSVCASAQVEATNTEAGSKRKKVCFEPEPHASTVGLSIDASKRSALIENIAPPDSVQLGKLSRAEELMRWKQMKSDTEPLSAGLLGGGAARRTSVLQSNGANVSGLGSGAARSAAAAGSSTSSTSLAMGSKVGASAITGTSLLGSVSAAETQKFASRSTAAIGLGGLPGRVSMAPASSGFSSGGMPRRGGNILPQR